MIFLKNSQIFLHKQFVPLVTGAGTAFIFDMTNKYFCLEDNDFIHPVSPAYAHAFLCMADQVESRTISQPL